MIPGVAVPTTGKLGALARVPIGYLLEWYVYGVIKASIAMPNHPTMITIKRSAATDIQFTFDEEPIRELSENRAAMIEVRGTSGWRARAGYNRLGQVIFAQGPEILKEFDRFLDEYQDQARFLASPRAPLPGGLGTLNLGAPPSELVFRSLDDGIAYKVEIGDFIRARDAVRSRMTSDWAIGFRGYRRAALVSPLNIFSPVSDVFEAAAAKIDEANAYLAVAGNVVTNVRGDLESFRAPLLAAQRSAQALGSVADAARSVAAFPRDLVSDFANTALELRAAWEDTKGALSLLDPTEGGALRAEWDRLVRTVGFAAEDSQRDALIVLGLSGGSKVDLDQAARRSGVDRPGVSLSPQTVPLTLSEGEDLRDISKRIFGTRERWIELAQLNGWPSPYRTGSGALARAGTQIRVPALDVNQISTSQNDPLERDLYISLDGELDFTSGDARTVGGVENLTQALRNRFSTEVGEIPAFPNYGLPGFTGKKLGAATVGLAASHFSDQSTRDARILSVDELVVEDRGDRLVMEALLTPSAAPPFRTVIPF